MPTDFLSVLASFSQAKLRYVLVGGLAVVLHGVDRLTADIDLVVDLSPAEAAKAIDLLLASGFKPGVPVDPRLFADETVRRRWQTESGMRVLSFWDPENRRPTVDLFADYPMNFETLFADSLLVALAGVTVRVASIPHMVAIKRAAGRPKDLDDAARLEALLKGHP
jgi:hypothetical protein